MSKARYGPQNHMWKNGRSIASNGYVLIRVGTEHHLADVRGYAYEHRLVAEEKLGRRLRKGEIVHHINGDKIDNRPENLAVVSGMAEHKVLHRKAGKALRMPGEENSLIECACGCGQTFHKYDEQGRPRRFVSGHNGPEAPTVHKILELLSYSPTRLRDLYKYFKSRYGLKSALSKMKKQGLVDNPRIGVWVLKRSD